MLTSHSATLCRAASRCRGQQQCRPFDAHSYDFCGQFLVSYVSYMTVISREISLQMLRFRCRFEGEKGAKGKRETGRTLVVVMVTIPRAGAFPPENRARKFTASEVEGNDEEKETRVTRRRTRPRSPPLQQPTTSEPSKYDLARTGVVEGNRFISPSMPSAPGKAGQGTFRKLLSSGTCEVRQGHTTQLSWSPWKCCATMAYSPPFVWHIHREEKVYKAVG